jgi:hypothetical protein
MLALQKANYEVGNKFINYVSMAAYLPVWKRARLIKQTIVFF